MSTAYCTVHLPFCVDVLADGNAPHRVASKSNFSLPRQTGTEDEDRCDWLLYIIVNYELVNLKTEKYTEVYSLLRDTIWPR